MVGTAASHTLTYEAFSVGGQVGRQSIVRGVRTYWPELDIVIQESTDRDDKTSWVKSLILDGDFTLSASVHRLPELTGFGLMVHRPDGGKGFSWEWFGLATGNVFERPQGSGRVLVTVVKGDDYEELQSVEFRDDIALRYLDDMSKPPGTHTHELVVRRGSILKLAP